MPLGPQTHAKFVKKLNIIKSRIEQSEIYGINDYVQSFAAIHYASFLGDCDEVKYCLKKGANINAFSETNEQFPLQMTPLMIALACGNDDVVELLLENNADITAKDSNGENLLHFAARSNCVSLLETMEKRQYDLLSLLLIGDNKQATPLHQAIISGSFKFLKQALQFIPSTSGILIQGRNLLHYAFENSQPKAVRLLITHSDAKNLAIEKDYFERTPIEMAIASGNDEIAATLSGMRLKEIRKHPDFGKGIENICQDVINPKLAQYIDVMSKFEQMNGKPPRFNLVNPKGNCAGYAVHPPYYYATMGSKDEFYEMRRLIVKWDGTFESLQDTNIVRNLSGNYKNLEEVFEQFISGVVLLQNGFEVQEITELEQDDKKKLFKLVSDKEFYVHSHIAFHMTSEQLALLLQVWQTYKECYVLAHAAEHSTSITISKEAEFQYDDSNAPSPLPTTNNPTAVANQVVNIKYKLTGEKHHPMRLALSIFEICPPKTPSKHALSGPRDDEAQLLAILKETNAFVKDGKIDCNEVNNSIELAVEKNSPSTIRAILKYTMQDDHVRYAIDMARVKHNAPCLLAALSIKQVDLEPITNSDIFKIFKSAHKSISWILNDYKNFNPDVIDSNVFDLIAAVEKDNPRRFISISNSVQLTPENVEFLMTTIIYLGAPDYLSYISRQYQQELTPKQMAYLKRCNRKMLDELEELKTDPVLERRF